MWLWFWFICVFSFIFQCVTSCRSKKIANDGMLVCREHLVGSVHYSVKKKKCSEYAKCIFWCIQLVLLTTKSRANWWKVLKCLWKVVVQWVGCKAGNGERNCTSSGPKSHSGLVTGCFARHFSLSFFLCCLYTAPFFWLGQSLSLTGSSLPTAPHGFQPAHTGCGFMVALIWQKSVMQLPSPLCHQ